MTTLIATFGEEEDITLSGDDRKTLRFPVQLIDREDVGTPRESSKTKLFRLKVEVANSNVMISGLPHAHLRKVMFQFGKEYMVDVLKAGNWAGGDIVYTVKQRQCPFDPTQLEGPEGAKIEFDVSRITIISQP